MVSGFGIWHSRGVSLIGKWSCMTGLWKQSAEYIQQQGKQTQSFGWMIKLGFTVKGICAWAENKVFGAVGWSIPAQMRRILTPKVGTFYWKVCHDKVSTRCNLIKRGFLFEDNGI